ncbi:RICIN domain-containing protein [Micromonospora auratinigra]|uniref:Ricin-type beta-trefoil lectin domain n=1 Tax=Micromonospora auratinigra TaxID=261654 RepID=A0A1A8Z4E9_9ACTN|nr:RICIN domain-containing protein [Micromonospora auratinigra]SBT38809.1 Ricin-type beta-trefoil lectin domain [Micromonospora auratinigra]
MTMRTIIAVLMGVVAAVAPASAPASAAADQFVAVTDATVTSDTLLEPVAARIGATLRFVPPQGRSGRVLTSKATQQWNVPQVKVDGVFVRDTFNLINRVESDGRRLCLDVEGDSKQAGARLVLRPCDGTSSQMWTRPGSPIGAVLLVNRWSGLVMNKAGDRVTQQQIIRAESSEERRTAFQVQQFNFPRAVGLF